MRSERERILLAAGMIIGAVVLHFLFARFGGGLITPEGSVSPGVAVLGIFMLTTRLVAVFGVPVIVAFTVGTRLVDAIQRKRARP